MKLPPCYMLPATIIFILLPILFFLSLYDYYEPTIFCTVICDEPVWFIVPSISYLIVPEKFKSVVITGPLYTAGLRSTHA